MMDDFGHPFGDGPTWIRSGRPRFGEIRPGGATLEVHRSLGVRVEARDPLTAGFGFPNRSLDVVTTFDSMEHWHHSPKRLFASVMEALKPGGLFVIGGPNAVNLRKRITVPLGRGKWTEMAHWYETQRFRGHVREPDVDDRRYIARELGLTAVEVSAVMVGLPEPAALRPRRDGPRGSATAAPAVVVQRDLPRRAQAARSRVRSVCSGRSGPTREFRSTSGPCCETAGGSCDARHRCPT